MTNDQFEEMMTVLKAISSKLDSIYSDIPSLPSTSHDLDDIYREIGKLTAAVQNLER